MVGEVDDVRADDENPRAAVLDEAGDLRGGETKVERRERRARLAGPDQIREEMVVILAEIGDPLLRPDARRDQRVGDARGHRVEVREGDRPALESERWRAAPAQRLHARRVRYAGDPLEIDHCFFCPYAHGGRAGCFPALCARFLRGAISRVGSAAATDRVYRCWTVEEPAACSGLQSRFISRSR